MRETMIALELLSLVTLGIILIGSAVAIKNKRSRNAYFNSCVGVVMTAEFVDMLAWWFNGRSDLTNLIYMLNFLAYILGYSMGIAFVFYLWMLIKETQDVPKWIYKMVLGVGVVYMLLFIFAELNNKIFSVVNGNYLVGEWYPFSQLYHYFCMTVFLVMILYYAKYLGTLCTMACLSYLVLPLISILLHLVWPQYSFTYIAYTLSMVIIYVMIQADYEKEYIVRENSLIEASTRDALTGLYNRRAYDMACNQMKKFDKVGVFFCDANGLKKTNDEQGHQAGDRLLLNVANGLIDIFSRNQVFRISGDEFVVMCPNMTYEVFHAQGISLKAFVRRNGMPIASVGEAYGNGVDTFQLIKEAEQQMYIDKERFYHDFPRMERRNR